MTYEKVLPTIYKKPLEREPRLERIEFKQREPVKEIERVKEVRMLREEPLKPIEYRL